MNKEGIMEDNRKGTWEDVTGECEVHWYSFSMGGYAEVQHSERSIAFLGPAVVVCKDPNYRVANGGGGLNHPGYMRVEHFIPEPEWVDVTDECVAEVHLRRVDLIHNGICVALMGHQVNTDCGTSAKDYRVTTIPPVHDTFSGFLK